MRFYNGIAILGIAAALSVPMAAHAADLGTANSFNVWVLGNASITGSTDAEGAIAVGGNLNLPTTYTAEGHNAGGTIGTDTNVAAYIGGNVSGGGQLGANNSGNVYIGGTNSDSLQLNGGKLFTSVSSSIFASQAAYSHAQSSYLSTLAGTTVDTSNFNQWTLDASTAKTYTVGSDTLAVFNVAASALSDNAIININNAGSDTVLINVTGSLNGVTWNADAQNFNGKSKLLWNYTGSDSFTIGRQFDGSLLAANASVTQSSNGQVDGTLIANNWVNQGSEDHSYIFNGNLPTPPAVPEAASVWGFGAMMGVAGISLRRRKSR